MKTVGIRELKNRLSEYVREVRSGERVLVSDRGLIVAELREADAVVGEGVPSGLAALAKDGHLTLASLDAPPRYARLPRLAAAIGGGMGCIRPECPFFGWPAGRAWGMLLHLILATVNKILRARVWRAPLSEPREQQRL